MGGDGQNDMGVVVGCAVLGSHRDKKDMEN